jgi:hypothetical protein
VGFKQHRRQYALGGLFLAIALITIEEIFDVELLGEAVLGLVCIVLIASSVSDGGASEVPADSADAARAMGKPSF